MSDKKINIDSFLEKAEELFNKIMSKKEMIVAAIIFLCCAMFAFYIFIMFSAKILTIVLTIVRYDGDLEMDAYSLHRYQQDIAAKKEELPEPVIAEYTSVWGEFTPLLEELTRYDYDYSSNYHSATFTKDHQYIFLTPPFSKTKSYNTEVHVFKFKERRKKLLIDQCTKSYSWNDSYDEDICYTFLEMGVSHNGKRMVTNGTNNRIFIWDAETGKVLHKINAAEETSGRVTIRFSTKDRYFVAASLPCICIYDVETGRLVQKILLGNDANGFVLMDEDENTLYTASSGSQILAWDLETGVLKKQTPFNRKGYYYIGSNEQSHRLFYAKENGSIRSIDVKTGETYDVDGHEDINSLIDVSKDGRFILIRESKDYHLRVIDLKNGFTITTIPVFAGDAFFSDDHKTVTIIGDPFSKLYTYRHDVRPSVLHYLQFLFLRAKYHSWGKE